MLKAIETKEKRKKAQENKAQKQNAVQYSAL